MDTVAAMRLGILGGSFNPIHHGHLILAERAAEALKLDRLLIIPTAITPLKNPRDLASARDRLAMVRAAVHGHPFLEASDFEIRRRRTSYSIDTLRAFTRPGTQIFLIVGSDIIPQLPRWKEIRQVARLCTFAIATRAAVRPARMPTYIVDRKVSIPLVEISGTEIRDRVRRGRSIRYLVPDAVASYIRRRKLYR